MHSIARSLVRFSIRTVAAASFAALIASGSAFAQEEPKSQPVKWDQARVTQYAVEMSDAIDAAVHSMRKSPMQNMPTQRMAWYELREDLRLLDNSATHLKAELQSGSGMEETRATFDRIEMLRRQAEEHGRRSEIPSPVMDSLVKAGSLHNRMRPYYLGRR
jgi:hypothetical protein